MAAGADLVALDEEDWHLALEKFRSISPLIGLARRTKAQIRDTAHRAGVNPATIYRWLERFEETSIVSSLLRKKRNDQGQARTDERAETIMKTVIRNEFLNGQAPLPTHAYREILRQCRKERIPAPHLSTFRRRLS